MRRALAAVAALALLAGCARPAPAREKPPLLFLTSLPILFGEDFSLDAPQGPLRTALEADFALKPIALADAASLGQPPGTLLMVQPRAQTAEALVDLDRWVRDGGHLLLLADPLLDWPTSKALGNPTAPMLAFADTGLLGHWGLTLYAPDAGRTAGSLQAAADGPCRTVPAIDNIIARCRIGKGQVTVIADADLVRQEEGAALVVDELKRLETRWGNNPPTELSTTISIKEK